MPSQQSDRELLRRVERSIARAERLLDRAEALRAEAAHLEAQAALLCGVAGETLARLGERRVGASNNYEP